MQSIEILIVQQRKLFDFTTNNADLLFSACEFSDSGLMISI